MRRQPFLRQTGGSAKGGGDRHAQSPELVALELPAFGKNARCMQLTVMPEQREPREDVFGSEHCVAMALSRMPWHRAYRSICPP